MAYTFAPKFHDFKAKSLKNKPIYSVKKPQDTNL